MAARSPIIPFFTDMDVPDSVGEVIRAAGHDLVRLRDVMLQDSPDPVVAAACRESGRVLVTHNYKDFRRIVWNQAQVTRAEVNRLCRIELACSQVIAARRIEEELPLIKFEWAQRLRAPDRAMRITIDVAIVRLARNW
jgi:predicted nuclease of predicted toxin-antitoxin system